MIDDVEAPLAAGPVDRRHVDEADELAALVVAQEAHDLDDLGRLRGDRQLAVGDRMPGHGAGQRRRERLAESVEGFAHARQRSIVPVRRIFFCSSSTP